jgi:hypothetical protein
MGWKSPAWIIAAVIAVVVLVGAASLWLLVHFDLFPDTDSGSVHKTTADGTHLVTVIAVDDSGQPANGYRPVVASPDPGSVAEVSGCAVSPAAVVDDIYHCAPNAAGADVC